MSASVSWIDCRQHGTLNTDIPCPLCQCNQLRAEVQLLNERIDQQRRTLMSYSNEDAIAAVRRAATTDGQNGDGDAKR
jgi:hypothetical protein